MLKKIVIALLIVVAVVWLGLPRLLRGLGLHPECPPFEGTSRGDGRW